MNRSKRERGLTRTHATRLFNEVEAELEKDISEPVMVDSKMNRLTIVIEDLERHNQPQLGLLLDNEETAEEELKKELADCEEYRAGLL